MDGLVTTGWLASALGGRDLCVIDATWFIGTEGRNAAAEYDAGHIPGAAFMDLAGLANSNSPYPMMLPTAETFSRKMQSLGVGNGCRIVVYDNSPYHSAARAWWMLRIFGMHDVALLDGGLAKWKAEGRTLNTGTETHPHRGFVAQKDERLVRSLDQVKANLTTQAEQILDARSAGRFSGDEPDLRGIVASGHIPGSFNLPYGALFNADGTWKMGDALEMAFAASGIDLDRPIVGTCGSGMTASVLVFGAHLLGKADISLYDGSWSEWGASPDTPKAMAAA